MSKQKESYRQILKATSLFGGVQVFEIIIAIARSKIIALLLGPTGMGIAGLLNSTIGMVKHLTSFGLNTSAVKDVSAANATNNKGRVATVVAVLRKLVWGTGLLGTLTVLVTAPYLSELTFGNKEYTWSFIFISVTLLFNQLLSGQSVIMRGTRRLKLLAKAGVWGSFLSLIVTAPLYYFWGNKGIVPAIIMTAGISLLVYWFYSRKIELKKISVSKLRLIAEGKEMMIMGFVLSLNGLVTTGASYIVKIFISNVGGVDEVGLYNAGMAIISSYAGMIFTAMSKDYYPRLAESAEDLREVKTIVNQQTEIAILILGPMILVFLVFIKWVVLILYSTQFTPINGMIHWAVLGMFFKAAGWAIGYIFLAKGDSNRFLWNQLVSTIYTLGLHIAGYYIYGLLGLGISYLAGYILYVIQVYVVTNINYEFSFEKGLVKIFVIQSILAVSCFITVYLFEELVSYIVGTILILISSVIALNELNNRMDFLEILNRYK